MSIGLTLHRAPHLVKFDVDFLAGYDRQIIKRIWQIGQETILGDGFCGLGST